METMVEKLGLVD